MKFKYIKSKINQLEGLKQYGDIDYENSKLLDELKQALSICSVMRSLPTNVDYLSEVRVKLFDEHVERLSKQTKEWNLMEGIRLGLNAEKP